MKENSEVRIAGIGACVMDTLITVPAYPKEDTKYRAVASKAAGGGPAATGIVAAAKLGSKAGFLGVLAGDGSGAFLKADFEHYGVDVTGVELKSGYRGFTSTIWLAQDTASRTCVFDKGNLPPYTLGETGRKVIADADILMIDGNEIDAAYEACLTARQNGTKVLYDCGGLYEGVERLLALTDVMIPSEEFALGHTGCETVEAAAKALYERYHPEIVVITCGKKGGILYGRAEGGLREASQEAASGVSVSKGEERKQRRLQTEGTELLSEAYPAFPVEAVDTNGSGDVFHGAFAAAMTRGWNYRECCIFASAVSAIKCTGFGARESVPDYETVMEFLKERGQIGRGRLS